ncbi:fibroleukin [Python bivittatus]|uniref:Fibroleukin n=1 Tax=Python bivittatus TaxID=176946 RepID=A0A9F2R5S8_PYTBI|nr:fibroleukin [Python bivittatus]
MKLAYKIFLQTVTLLFTNRFALSEENAGRGEEAKASPACPLMLQSSGKCDGEECPYQINFPPMTLQLPKQFQLIEKTLKEVQHLKEMVNNLKKSCQDCKLQADDNQEKNSNEFLPPDTDGPTNHSKIQDNQGTDLQEKVSKLSDSLKNAKNQIHTLHGRLEKMNLINMNNVENYVDNKVANLTFFVNSLDVKCSSQCPAIESKPVIQLLQGDCSNHFAAGNRRNGIYKITPDPRKSSFDVYCDMESFGGGWTVFQMRQDGSVSFNRTWEEYKNGFGNGREFWLGNDKIHLLTKSKEMQLRIELEDFSGIREYAKYDQFYVANEYLRYRLNIGSYSGTAGDALHFNKFYNHDQKFFTTPDRDNDRYVEGNCGAYYSSGWWFDACLAANLNGKYYNKKYKGVRNGIFWGTWPGASDDNMNGYRKPFRKVKMMMRPQNFVP